MGPSPLPIARRSSASRWIRRVAVWPDGIVEIGKLSRRLRALRMAYSACSSRVSTESPSRGNRAMPIEAGSIRPVFAADGDGGAQRPSRAVRDEGRIQFAPGWESITRNSSPPRPATSDLPANGRNRRCRQPGCWQRCVAPSCAEPRFRFRCQKRVNRREAIEIDIQTAHPGAIAGRLLKDMGCHFDEKLAGGQSRWSDRGRSGSGIFLPGRQGPKCPG